MTSPILLSAQSARKASLVLASLPLETRNRALIAMADAVAAHRDEILAENQKDLDAAEQLIAKGEITKASAARLKLAGSKFDTMIEGLHSVASLPDPIGIVQKATELDEGLNLYRISCPIGVIGMIFESRPDALPQIASLCLKSGNAVLMKGGSEALHSNRALARVLLNASRSIPGIPEGWMALLETREDVKTLLSLDEYINLIIPRGSNEFVRYIMDNTSIPVMGHRDGICHTYIHESADPDKAIRIAVDAKCQYPAVCNATETLLIDKSAAPRFLKPIAEALKQNGVELRLDAHSKQALPEHADALDATEADWKTEYLDLILSIRIVSGLEEAIHHINRYGSHHTDAIITENTEAAEKFLREVDSAAVIHNASTRFSDGYRFGLGAEVGISTEKIHSRGPVGLEGLTIYKYILRGTGQIVADYSGPSARKFTHRTIS